MSWNTNKGNLMNAVSPRLRTGLGSKVATTTDWDSDATAEFLLPSKTEYCDVWVSDLTMLIATTSDADPISDCAPYPAGLTHRVDAKNASYLHYKSVGANGKIMVTAVGN